MKRSKTTGLGCQLLTKVRVRSGEMEVYATLEKSVKLLYEEAGW